MLKRLAISAEVRQTVRWWQFILLWNGCDQTTTLWRPLTSKDWYYATPFFNTKNTFMPFMYIDKLSLISRYTPYTRDMTSRETSRDSSPCLALKTGGSGRLADVWILWFCEIQQKFCCIGRHDSCLPVSFICTRHSFSKNFDGDAWIWIWLTLDCRLMLR